MKRGYILIPITGCTALSVSQSWNALSEYRASRNASAGGRSRCSGIHDYRLDSAVDHEDEKGAHLLLYVQHLHSKRVLGRVMEHVERLAALAA
jgi:hypothetical protein